MVQAATPIASALVSVDATVSETVAASFALSNKCDVGGVGGTTVTSGTSSLAALPLAFTVEWVGSASAAGASCFAGGSASKFGSGARRVGDAGSGGRDGAGEVGEDAGAGWADAAMGSSEYGFGRDIEGS